MKRKTLNIQPYRETNRGFDWSADKIALLGTVPDSELAQIWRLSKSTVHLKRKVFGIAPCRPTPAPHVKWTAEMDALLSTMSNSQIAQQLGINPQSVAIRRRKLGIVNRAGSKRTPHKASNRLK
jgi:hypothetical protein